MRWIGSQRGAGATIALCASVLTAALAGCGSGTAPSPTAASTAVAPSTPSTPIPDAAGSSPQATASTEPVRSPVRPGAVTSRIPDLPDSTLSMPRGYALAPIPGAPSLGERMVRINPRAPSAIAGVMNRAVTRKGVPIGGLQMFRTRPPYTSREPMEALFDQLLKEYTQLKALSLTRVGDRQVLFLDRLRGQPVSVVSWWQGRDVFIVFTRDPKGMEPVLRAVLKPRDRV